jgi:A/G-specific adenine glycosylase
MSSSAKRGLGATAGSTDTTTTDNRPARSSTGKRLKAAAAQPAIKAESEPSPKAKAGRSQGGAGRSSAVAVADIEDCALPPGEQVAFRAALLSWYDAHRRQLPWRGDPPPYGASFTSRTEAAAAAALAASVLGSGKKASPGKKASSLLGPPLVAGQSSLSRFFKAPPKFSSPNTIDAVAPDVDVAPTSSPHFATAAASSPLPSPSSLSSPPEATAAVAAAATTTATTTTTPGVALRRPAVSAYGTWVCEVMSQQTRIETVVDYWTKWMALFPTVAALAAATPEEVCSWIGWFAVWREV